jgi:hypothetical protein
MTNQKGKADPNFVLTVNCGNYITASGVAMSQAPSKPSSNSPPSATPKCEIETEGAWKYVRAGTKILCNYLGNDIALQEWVWQQIQGCVDHGVKLGICKR